MYVCMYVCMYACSISFLKHFSKEFVALHLQWMGIFPGWRKFGNVATRVLEVSCTRGGIAQIQYLHMAETTVLAIRLER